MMTDNERKRLRELNSKNEEFNKRLYENARSYAKGLFALSILALLILLLYCYYKRYEILEFFAYKLNQYIICYFL